MRYLGLVAVLFSSSVWAQQSVDEIWIKPAEPSELVKKAKAFAANNAGFEKFMDVKIRRYTRYVRSVLFNDGHGKTYAGDNAKLQFAKDFLKNNAKAFGLRNDELSLLQYQLEFTVSGVVVHIRSEASSYLPDLEQELKITNHFILTFDPKAQPAMFTNRSTGTFFAHAAKSLERQPKVPMLDKKVVGHVVGRTIKYTTMKKDFTFDVAPEHITGIDLKLEPTIAEQNGKFVLWYGLAWVYAVKYKGMPWRIIVSARTGKLVTVVQDWVN